LIRIFPAAKAAKREWFIRLRPTLFIAAFLWCVPCAWGVNPAITGRPDRVLLVIGDQWDDPSSFLIRTDNELHEIASLLKNLGTPFDILRLDQQPLVRGCSRRPFGAIDSARRT